ncbi:hypothetical protein Poli38472_009952 [Pythium oligandrum]|uniref:Uncharacterized protein n=1 Tax=Pythium oligandrum TaxID=41045 RepID=A0A8K1FH41_PYTOL|nr:hypothetical protein Poli38472_009952 [Pythium oligandrum]|eukprot:TMW58393.1 hypothetical protein Poli38472_009952 [Pythium oligandrum]
MPRGLPYSRWERANDNVDVFNIICGDYITIPSYLDDGDYVLQFTNFGTGHSNGITGQATPTYRSCADLRVTGGSSKNARPKCPGFQGGDRVTYNENMPNNQCYYYKDNFVPNYLFQENDVGKLNGLYRLGRPKLVEDCNSRSLDLESYPAENYNATHDYSFDALN